MRTRWPHQLLRWLASAAMAAGIVYICEPIPRLDPTAVSMLLLLAVIAIAARWGIGEAAVASVIGGLLLDYFILPPKGWSVDQPAHWTALLTFLITSGVIGRYSARLKQRAREAAEQRAEMGELYRLAEVMLSGDTYESVVTRVVQHAPEIFNARASAYYDVATGTLACSSAEICAGFEEDMREVALGGEGKESSGTRLIAVRLGTRTIGTFGLWGDAVPEGLMKYVSHTLSVGLERAKALEEAAHTEAARESEELRSAALDALAHDLKTPLTSIKAAVTSLLNVCDSEHHELLSIIDEEADRLERLSNQAIEMERIGIGMLHAEKQRHDLRPAIMETIEELRPVLRTRTIAIEFAEALPTAEFDLKLIKQALRQLLDNARKYSPQGSPITVACRASNGGVIVQVADFGPGIAEEEQERVFEKFYRGDRGTAGAGVGLGLAIARSIVKAHGGEIWVTSRPGRGSVFQFSLPGK